MTRSFLGGAATLVAAGLSLAAAAAPALFAAPALAQGMPPAGRMFGFIQVDDHGAYGGNMVVAYVNGTACGQGVYDNDRGLFIVDLSSGISDCAVAGSAVSFSVDGCMADQTGIVPEVSGAQRVDLVAPSSC
jgi:hypothetical protein